MFLPVIVCTTMKSGQSARRVRASVWYEGKRENLTADYEKKYYESPRITALKLLNKLRLSETHTLADGGTMPDGRGTVVMFVIIPTIVAMLDTGK